MHLEYGVLHQVDLHCMRSKKKTNQNEMDRCHSCGSHYKRLFKNVFADFKTMISDYGKK